MRVRDDLGVMVAGQGGDGSLTLANLLGDVMGARGYELYQARNVLSRVKGGHAAAHLRASLVRRGCLGDRFDLLIAFDAEAVAQGGRWLDEQGWVVYDASEGPVDREHLPAGANVLEVPFGRLAVRDLRRDLFKNSLAFGVASRLFSVPDADAEAALRHSLRRLAGPLVEANVRALERGFEYADEHGLVAGTGPWALGSGDTGERVLISGNEALALGFLAAGGRFYAGYPITPASEILEWLSARLPEFGGVAVQAEDELAAINMALGAAMTGTRSMTASSGPGIALMQETVSHLGSAEVGVVVVDCQRAGPSTGMPTKPEQSDVGMLVWGSSGDFPRVVLAPGDPVDAFELGAFATNLAERFQGPVYVALDQMVSQDLATVDRFHPGAVEIDRRTLLGEAELATLGEYRRYAIDDGGISRFAPVGTWGGQGLVTGNERDEWGRVSTQPANRARMVEKRARKLETIVPDLPRGREAGDPDADVALLGFGMQTGVCTEAAERLAAAGRPVRVFQPRTLWPVLEDVRGLVLACRRVYVVESNASAQYAHVLAGAGLPAERLESVLRYDGLPFRAGELAARVLEREAA
jgi:2-oxoglutarate ferredoxin oxidoreductase subunit alpha